MQHMACLGINAETKFGRPSLSLHVGNGRIKHSNLFVAYMEREAEITKFGRFSIRGLKNSCVHLRSLSRKYQKQGKPIQSLGRQVFNDRKNSGVLYKLLLVRLIVRTSMRHCWVIVGSSNVENKLCGSPFYFSVKV